MQKQLPKHVAIIMDGNGRWAKKQGHPRIFGHREGTKRITEIVKASLTKKIPYLSLFAFSTENWNRPKMEVKFLMNLLDRTLTKKLIERFNQQDIYFHWTGFEEKLSTSLINKIKATEQATSANKRKLVINFCFNYGGMQDIFQAAQQVKKQTTLSGFAQLLLTSDLPPVDLLIRTGDEKRISNFLLFQSAYAEIIFESTLWPKYTKATYYNNLEEYNNRHRRYGEIND